MINNKLTKREYNMDTSRLLTAQEYKDIDTLFAYCNYAEIEDMALYPTGSHRALYARLTHLGFTPPPGRGPVYHFADGLLSYNKYAWQKIIIETISEKHDQDSEVLQFAKLFLGITE
jgi:hypothetical protein